jgi:SAM-dependent methyltransferase
MRYDPIKKDAGRIFNCCRSARVLFYRILNILLLRAWHVRREISRWAKVAPADANILDAGSGFGQYVWMVSRLDRSFTVKGIDLKVDELAVCNRFFGGPRSGGRIIFEKADLTLFTEPDRYDLALCIDVLEHIEDDTGVMQNLCRSLKPGGMLIISTPSDKGGSDVHEEGDSSFIGEHVRDGYGIEEITRKLTGAGFSKVEAGYTYRKWGRLSWLISMKYPVRMLNASKMLFLLLPLYYLIIFPIAMVLNFCDLYGSAGTGTGLLVKAWR